jgi:hypothetical protein
VIPLGYSFTNSLQDGLEIFSRSDNPAFDELQFRGDQRSHFFHCGFVFRNASDSMLGIRMLSEEIVFASNGTEDGCEMRPETCASCEEG